MGAFAGLLQRAGYSVRGSDEAAYPPMSEKLREWGIEVATPYAPQNLEPVPDLVIVGNAIRSTNPEAQAAVERGLTRTSFPAGLSDLFLRDRHAVVVSGTHGKTTTSALIAHLLLEAGRDPSFLVGGIPLGVGESFRLGGGPHFVVEGDEYDTAYFDKQPKFVHYRPRTAVITSLEYDHADIYENVEAIERAFDALVGLVPPDGRIIACATAPRVMARVKASRAPVLTYGVDQGDRTAGSLEVGPFGARFETAYAGRLEPFSLPSAGTHNVENALAALAVAEAAHVPAEAARSALTSFQGVARRQTVRGVEGGVRVIDDFAHHPTAVDRTLRGLAAQYPEGRLFAVFEPRTATSARRVFADAYARAFDAAHDVTIAPVGRPELGEDERLDTDALARAIAARGVAARAGESIDAIVADLSARCRPGDTVVFMSNGGFGGIHDKMLDALRAAGS